MCIFLALSNFNFLLAYLLLIPFSNTELKIISSYLESSLVIIHSLHEFRKIREPSCNWDMKYQYGTGFVYDLIRHVSILVLHIAYNISKRISLYCSYPHS